MAERMIGRKTIPEGFTFLGRTHTKDTINKIREALLGQPKPPEVVKKRSTVWEIIRPLFLRGGTPLEIESVTDFSIKQINGAIYRTGRPEWYSIPPHMVEDTSNKSSRSHKLMWRRRKGILPEGHERVSEVAKALVKEGYFTDDLGDRRKLQELYGDRKRLWPEDFALALCCEAYFAARIDMLKNSNRDMLDRYIEIVQGLRKGNKLLCPEMLANEQKFILDVVEKLKPNLIF